MHAADMVFNALRTKEASTASCSSQCRLGSHSSRSDITTEAASSKSVAEVVEVGTWSSVPPEEGTLVLQLQFGQVTECGW